MHIACSQDDRTKEILMKLLLLSCAVLVFTLAAVAGTVQAAERVDAYARAGRRPAAPVHVGHVGPYCVYYVGKHGDQSPYRYRYNDWRYPRYYGGTHARVLQHVGVSPADIGIRGSAW
jgi:hypothetical protein